MDLVDFLRSPEASLPRLTRKGDFRDVLREALDAYMNGLSAITSRDHASKEVLGHIAEGRALASGLLAALDASLDGQASNARRALENALSSVQAYLQGLLSVPVPRSKLGVLYRMRSAPSFPGLGRKDMFHIPFELRHIVKPQRFSVLGLPMLYLGNTLYVCWEELERPSLNDVWISALRLQVGQDLKVLDFAYRPGLMAQLLEDAKTPASATPIGDLVAAYSMVWPLIAACTFPALERKSPFVVEYVIPQLLMAWLAESGEYRGIRYFSTHVIWPPSAAPASINFALPARPSAPTGHSQVLAQLFEGTDAVAWPFLGAIGAASSPLYHGPINAALSVGAGHVAPYATTDFARMESYLDTMTFGPIV